MKFTEMNLDRRTLSALDEMAYIDATEVQEKTIPFILQGASVVVRSQTGTGKTAAFGIGLIETLSKDRTKKGLILAPTRELANQIANELRSIAKNHRMSVYAIYGGQGMGHQIASLRRGFDIVVATPGRLLDHVQRGTIHLSSVNCVVLDEADRMLDMGFKHDIDRILRQLNPTRQVMLFSATLEPEIRKLIGSYIKSPEVIEVGPVGKIEKIDEEFIKLSRAEKLDRLKQILSNEPGSRIIVFVAAKWAVEEICHKLNRHGIEAKYLHGGKSQTQRERTVREFQEGRFRILIATDVASRGLHIEDVSHVINYDQADSTEIHTHRIGRTGRMGKGGRAITFVETDPLPKKRRGGGGGSRGGSGYQGRRDHGSSSSYGHGGHGYGGEPKHSSYGSSNSSNSSNSSGQRNRPRDRRHRRY